MEHYNLEKDIASDLKEQFELESPNFADRKTMQKSMDRSTASTAQTRGTAPLGTAWSVATSPAMLGALGAFAASHRSLQHFECLRCLRSRTKRAAIATWQIFLSFGML